MGRSANLSPLGLYNWDPTVFDLMEIPEDLDRDTLISNLLAETAELEVIYPNPVVFKNLVGVWSKKCLDVWTRLYNTTQYEYNPIENYNRYEEGSISDTGRTTHSGTDSTTETITHGGTDTRTIEKEMGGSDTNSGSSTDGHWIAGFDSVAQGTDDGLVKQTRDQRDQDTTTQYGSTEDVTDSIQHGATINRTNGLSHGETISNTNDRDHDLHAHGNIGVMSTQQMIEQERQIDLFNIYDIIIQDFKMRFCILIY